MTIVAGPLHCGAVEGNPDEEQTRRSGVQKMFSAVKKWLVASPRHVGYAAVGLVLLLTLPFGGLAATPEEEAPRHEAGETVDFAPWQLTVEKAIWGPDLGSPFFETEGRNHVLVLGQLATTASETLGVGELRDSLWVRAEGIELGDPYGNVLPDGQFSGTVSVHTTGRFAQALSAVSPGLTYDVALHLTTPDEMPETLELELATKTHRLSSLQDTMLWTDPVASATVVVPTERSGPVFENIWSVEP